MFWILFILGAILAGFVQGLTGFAFALIAMSFWAWVLEPQLAAPLLVFASVWSHIISLSQEKTKPVLCSKHLLIPYILAGLIGVPVGTYILQFVDAIQFRLILGIFLIIWCPMMLLKPQFQLLQNSGRFADSIIGFLGGMLGGLGGFCGALPSAWVMLKNLDKAEQRYILRHFNFAIQIFTLGVYIFQGTFNLSQLNYILILIFAVSIPAILGAKLFYRISEQQFKRIVLSLLFASGIFLITSSII